MLTLENVSFEVQAEKGQKEIIRNMNLTIDDRKFVVITGPNGGGKSTLAKLIAGIEKPTAGKIYFNGTDITEMSITERANMGISFAFQQPVRFKGIQVLDLIRLAAKKNLSAADACQYLSEVGLCARDYINREVNGSLSGGELKRIEIATVLARGTKMSVFDEPEAGIDLWSFQNLIQVFERMREKTDGSILIISHQERILNIADEIVVIADGSITSQGPKDEILPKLLGTASAVDACERFYQGGMQKEGAYNIRANGASAGRNTTANIDIVSKTDVSGIDIRIKPGTKHESVHIPVVLSESGIKETVYNDFYIGEDSDIVIVAGCGIHNCGNQDSEHDGIHRFYVGKNAKVKYVEKHYGEGDGNGKRILNPGTEVYMEEGSSMEMEMVQIKGVDSTIRTTVAELAAGARLVVRERLLTHGSQQAVSDYVVRLNGADASADVVSRSVAKDDSYQKFDSQIVGNAKCSGHTECDAIIMGNAKIVAVPQLEANNIDAALIHEAAIGKIAGEQIIKLMTLGLTEEEAEAQIVNGFLK